MEFGGGAGDFDGLFDLADFEREVDGPGLGDVEFEAFLDGAAETFGLDGDLERAEGELLEGVGAGRVGGGFVG